MDSVLLKLTELLEQRKSADPESSYVAGLHAKGINKILEKVGEEATETILAAKDVAAAAEGSNGSIDKTALINETADLWFHTMVMLGHLDCEAAEVLKELERRFGMSGLEEKAARNN